MAISPIELGIGAIAGLAGLFGKKSKPPTVDPQQQMLMETQRQMLTQQIGLLQQAQEQERQNYLRWLQMLPQFQSGLQSALQGLGFAGGQIGSALALPQISRLLAQQKAQQEAVRRRLASMGVDTITQERVLEGLRERGLTEAMQMAGEFDLQRRQAIMQLLGAGLGATAYNPQALLGIAQLTGQAGYGAGQQLLGLRESQLAQQRLMAEQEQAKASALGQLALMAGQLYRRNREW